MSSEPKSSNRFTDREYFGGQISDRVSDYAMLSLDVNGIITHCNSISGPFRGYSLQEIIGKHYSFLHTAEEIAKGKPQQNLVKSIIHGYYEETAYRLRKDGSSFLAHVIINPIIDPQGKLHGFCKVTHDITDKILAEQRLQESEKRLSSLVNTVLDTIVDGVITINAKGQIQSYNKACFELFGYTAEEVIGQNIRMLMPLPYRREHDSYLENYEKTGKAKIIGIGREVSGQRKDGSVFPMELAVGQTNQNVEHAYVGIIRDISERREAEKAREQLRQSQKMEALGQLTSGIAHDFNNLLAVILGNLDFLKEKTEENSPLQDHITPAIEATEHGAVLTRQLLAFGRKQSLQPKSISLNDLLTHFSQLVQRTLNERIEIILRLDTEAGNVHVDPSMLENALLNLAINARDAMPDGGKLIFETKNIYLNRDYADSNIDVVAGDYVMIKVSDTGSGMTKEVLEKAFEPFFTTKGTGLGTGLGLSMVYGFVKQSSGHIKLSSEATQGTSVKIYLPKVEGTITPDTGKEHVRILSRDPKQKTVLVVEDNKNVLKLTSSIVENLGYTVISTTTGDDAYKILEARDDISLLLTDVMLPGKINGPELAKLAVEKYPAIKIVFNSGYTENTILHNGMLDHGAVLISKPFRIQQLASTLLELLNQ